jgi:pimeloyl-ACP methyl ester carboxylesterase
MYNRQTIEDIPALIEGIQKNNYNDLIRAIRTVQSTLNIINGVMYMSVAAYEELPFSGLKEIESELSALPSLYPGPAFFMSDPYVLERWHSFRAPEREDQPVSSDHPILLVSGLLDPVTPPSNAKTMLPHLSNARHIVFEQESHANFYPCYFYLLMQFFNNPAAELDNCYENDNPLRLN